MCHDVQRHCVQSTCGTRCRADSQCLAADAATMLKAWHSLAASIRSKSDILASIYVKLRLGRKFGPHMFCHGLFVPDIVDTSLADGSLCPPLEPGRLFLQKTRQFNALKAMFRLSERQDSQEERATQNLVQNSR